MTTSNISLLIVILSLLFFSCKDQGADVEPLQILAVTPSPNTVAIDKSRPITLLFNHEVYLPEIKKIQLRYTDGTSIDGTPYFCNEVCTSISNEWNYAPPLWKPGKSVEVTIPISLKDIDGQPLSTTTTFRFSIAEDSVAFQLESSFPRSNDTLSVGRYNGFGLSLLFTDYVAPPFFPTISPPATIRQVFIVPGGARDNRENFIPPLYAFVYSITDIQVGVTYTVTIPRQTKDYEGETLPQDYHLVFYTRP